MVGTGLEFSAFAAREDTKKQSTHPRTTRLMNLSRRTANRSAKRHWALCCSQEKRGASASAAGKAKEGGGHARLFDQGGRALGQRGCSGHNQERAICPGA